MTANAGSAIRARLVSQGAITSMVGQRVYPSKAPQGTTRPYILHQRQAGEHGRHMLGGDGLARADVEITVVANSPDTANTVAEAVRLVLHGYRGRVTVGDGFLDIRHCHLEFDAEQVLPPEGGSDDSIYLVTQTYSVGYHEPIPTPRQIP